jgi:hypothetical protein
MTISERSVICPGCGAANLGDHPACLLCNAILPGAAQSVAAAEDFGPQLFCTACGQRLKEGRAFCGHCGAQVGT